MGAPLHGGVSFLLLGGARRCHRPKLLSFQPRPVPIAMAKSSRAPSAPLTFDLPESLVEKIEVLRRERDLKSVSEVVRLAVDEFDFTRCEFATDPFRQISVRIGTAQRGLLKRVARQKHASVGEVLRRAVEALPVKAAGAKKSSAR